MDTQIKNITIDKYEKQANDFCKKHGVTIDVKFFKYDYHFQNDEEKRDIYSVTISKGNRSMSFNFGNSLLKSGFRVEYGVTKKVLPISDSRRGLYLTNYRLLVNLAKEHTGVDFLKSSNDKLIKPIPPTAYDILACLQKYDVGTFEDFCSEFGYDEDRRKVLKTYNSVVSEYEDVCSLFNDEELEELQEIQ